MLDFLSIGDTMHDVFLEMTDETAHLHRFEKEAQEICFTFADKIPVKSKKGMIGGNSANAAVGFARLGFQSAIYTHVGDDTYGEQIISDFKREGVADDYIVVDRGLESNFNTVINLHGERTILIYHVHRHFVLPKLKPAKWVYLSSMGEGWDAIIPDLVAYLDTYSAKLVYQPGTFQLRYGAERTKELLKRTEFFAVNKEEAELYLGIEPTNDFRKLLDGLRALGPKTVLVSDGPKGAYATDGTDYLSLGIIPPDEAPRREATGAGDSFTTAFSAARFLGLPVGEALRWGQAQSSSVIQQVGPQAGLCTREQIDAILAAHPALQPQQIPG